MKWIKLLLAAFILTSPKPVQAQTGEEYYPFGIDAANYQPLNSEFNDSLSQLEELDRYEIQVSLSNEDTNQTYLEGRLLGDNTKGDLQIELDYLTYNQEGQLESIYPVRILTYDNMNLIYFNQIELLYELGAFEGEKTPTSLKNKMKNYTDYYTVLEQGEKKDVETSNNLLESLLFTPNPTELVKLPMESIKKVADTYIMSLQSTQIPAKLFNNLAHFKLDLDLDFGGDWYEREEGELDYWMSESNQSFTFRQSDLGIGISIGVNSDFAKSLELVAESISGSAFSIHTSPSDESTVSANLEMNSSMATSRMVDVSVSYNPKTLDYRASVEGIYEDVVVDIFGEKLASFKNPYYRFDYRIKPSQDEIISGLDLKRLTNQEFKYLVDKEVNQ